MSNPNDTLKITRTHAAALIEALREEIAIEARDGSPEAQRLARKLKGIMEGRYGIPSLQPCNGAAHSDPYIVCMCCAPRWGWTGPKVKVT